MKYLRYVVLCMLMLAFWSSTALAIRPPVGYVITAIITTSSRQHQGDTVNLGFNLINSSWGPGDMVFMDLGGTAVGDSSCPLAEPAPANPFPLLPNNREMGFVNATFQIPTDTPIGTVYPYRVDHYGAIFTGDFSQIWNMSRSAWEPNTEGYCITKTLPRYDQIPDYAYHCLTWCYNIEVVPQVPEPSSLAALFTGGVGLAGFGIRRKLGK